MSPQEWGLAEKIQAPDGSIPAQPGLFYTHSMVLLFLLTEDWFFASHFWARARAAQQAGWRVVLVARESTATAQIRASGIEVIPVAFIRRRLNPFAEALFVLRLARLYRRIKPELVHHVALKPIILGGIAAKLAGVRRIINAPVGLGFVYSSPKPMARFLRPLVALALRLTLTPPGALAVFENAEDMAAMAPRGAARLISGAGVDTAKFHPTPEAGGPVKILLMARMIREKGVADFVAAARLLQGQAEFLLAGAPDAGNPNALTDQELRGWEAEGVVRWLGRVEDVPALLASVHIACLPSLYGEGLPKTILEAMAAGRPVVASNIPGCRAAVRHGVTGLLVPASNPPALAAACAQLITSPTLRARLGAAGRARAEQEFSDETICAQTLSLYEELLSPRTTP